MHVSAIKWIITLVLWLSLLQSAFSSTQPAQDIVLENKIEDLIEEGFLASPGLEISSFATPSTSSSSSHAAAAAAAAAASSSSSIPDIPALIPHSFLSRGLSSSKSAVENFNTFTCNQCESVFAFLGPYIRTNKSEQFIGTIAVLGCELIKPQCKDPQACADICVGVVKEHEDEILQILGHTILSPGEACSQLFHVCPAPPPPPMPRPAIPVPSNLSDTTGETIWPSWLHTTGTGYFLHISDIHLDPYYTAGTNSQCDEPICCRPKYGPGTNVNNTAHYWGDYHCDTPLNLFQDLLNYVQSLSTPPDFILYTGDDPAHDIWEQSRSSNLYAIQIINQLIAEAFPNIPVFSTVGNHESYPVNQFEGPKYDSWLYNEIVAAWSHYLTNDAIHTIKYGGYYQQKVRPGLRVVSLNSNYFTSDDFWLRENDTDIASQFPWLIDVLLQARALNEKVIIICHAPVNVWEMRFANTFNFIVNDFEDVIVNMFFGHTHFTGYQLVHGNNSIQGKPLVTGFIGGSVVPFTNLNPGYAIYTYSRDLVEQRQVQFLATNAQQYWIDLVATNAVNKTNWSIAQIDFLADFGLADLSPASMSQLTSAIMTNTSLYNQLIYSRYKGVAQDPSVVPSAVGLSCDTQYNTKDLSAQCQKQAGHTTEQIEKHFKLMHDEEKC